VPFRPLIVIVNILLVLAGCATASLPQHQGVNPAPVPDAQATAAAQFQPGPGGGTYLTAASLNLYRLLPPPPEAGSAQERVDLDELLRLQAARTPTEVQRARDDANVTVFRFADAFGNPANFKPQSLPLVAKLFDRITGDEGLFMNAAKDAFGRPRPVLVEKRLAPVVAKPPSASYPSGHTTWAIAVAIVLADMVPERRAQIFARADEYAHNREVGGVHYPSDVAAGHLAGTALAVELFHSPRFAADEAAAAAELRQALDLPPHPAIRH
jgi:acid phosphatase (class A)